MEANELDAKHEALECLLAAHKAYYNVSRDYEYAGRTFPGYAEFHSSSERYVLVKRAKLWGVNTHEYLFFVLAEHLTLEQFEDLTRFMRTDALDKVTLEPEHMTSYLSLVIIADTVDDDVLKQAKKTRFRKNFNFGVGGWADMRVAVVDLARASITTNAMGKELRPTLEANITEKLKS